MTNDGTMPCDHCCQIGRVSASFEHSGLDSILCYFFSSLFSTVVSCDFDVLFISHITLLRFWREFLEKFGFFMFFVELGGFYVVFGLETDSRIWQPFTSDNCGGWITTTGDCCWWKLQTNICKLLSNGQRLGITYFTSLAAPLKKQNDGGSVLRLHLHCLRASRLLVPVHHRQRASEGDFPHSGVRRNASFILNVFRKC